MSIPAFSGQRNFAQYSLLVQDKNLMCPKQNIKNIILEIAKSLKNKLDKIFALITLIVLSPVILVVALLVYRGMGKPVIFAQLRPGKNGRIFTFYKFRTMTNKCDTNGNLLSDEQRLTALGKFLRRTSLDELPQLWNVLKGDMSLIGPRPLLVRYLSRYTPEQAHRHQVKPGITGLAQISGRNSLSWEEKFKLDVWYVNNWSLWLDLKILFLTIWKVIKREGISQEGQATMEEFTGVQPN